MLALLKWVGRGGKWVFIAFFLMAGLRAPGRTVPDAGDPLGFFTFVADKMLRSTFPFGVTNIPVYSNGVYVYTPAVQRLLQLSANLYDASNTNFFPAVFRPVIAKDGSNNVFITGYLQVTNVSGAGDPQLALPVAPEYCANFGSAFTPIVYPDGSTPVNVYGVPWILGAKKGLPSFNQLYLNNIVQVTRLLEATRTIPGNVPTMTNQMYVMSVDNNMGVSFWNSYSNAYLRPVEIHVNDLVSMSITNGSGTIIWPATGPNFVNFSYAQNIPAWPGSQWSGIPPNATINNINSFITNFWTYHFLPTAIYRFSMGGFDTSAAGVNLWDTTTTPYLQALPPLYLTTTNYFQGYILDGNHVIDYVQLRGPFSSRNLTAELADSGGDGSGMWNTNLNIQGVAWGLVHQMDVSMTGQNLPVADAWRPPPSQYPAGSVHDQAAYFLDFMVNPGTQIRIQTIQAAYTPSRMVYEAVLYQANDPLVHFLASDLKYIDPNSLGIHRSDDPQSSPIPNPSQNSKNARYQPWGLSRQILNLAGTDTNAYNVTYKDALVWGSDYWSFPTHLLSDLTTLGQVHRGTPWQTVYLKSTNILTFERNFGNAGILNVGTNTWTAWSGDSDAADATLMAPVSDWRLAGLLMSLLNTNDPVQLVSVNGADWTNVLNGLIVYSNANVSVSGGVVSQHFETNIMAGDSAQAGSIANAIRQTKSAQPDQTFFAVGDVFQTSLLSLNSPWINLSSPFMRFGINDVAYEAIPAQLLPLLRPDSIGLAPAGQGGSVRFSGADGYAYILQGSTNLTDWANISTNQPVQGVFTVPLSPAAADSGQFFRTQLAP